MKNIYIALENIRSLYNIGAIFRTCSFFGFYNVILVGYSGKDISTRGESVLHEKIHKSALGSENDLNIIMLENSNSLTDFASKKRLAIISIEQFSKSISFKQWIPKNNSIIVFGNEVDGVSQALLNASSEVVEIKKQGIHSSLNVTTAAGIVLNKINPS